MISPSPQLPVQLRMAAAFLQQGQITQAQNLLESYLKAQPKHLETLNALALVTMQTEQYDQAVIYLTKAIGIKPRVAGLHNNLGNAYQKLGKLPEALSAYQKAVSLDARFAQAFYNRGHLFQLLGQLDQALASFDKAIQIEPNYADAHNSRGTILHVQDQPGEALASYQRAIEYQPTHSKAHCNIADTYSALKQSEKALEHYQLALAYEPDYLKALNNQGVLLQELNRFEAALDCFDRALQIYPDSWDAHSNRGVTLLRLRRLEESVSAFERAIEIDPSQARLYDNLGNVLGELGRFEKALEVFEKAIQIDPMQAQLHVNQGIACQEMGNVNLALVSFDRALDLDPEDPEAHWNKAVALLLNGEFDKGWQEFEWRWKRKTAEKEKHYLFGKRLWLGDISIQNQTILLHSEQGLGDAIQFCRYASQVAKLGAKVILQVPPSLVELCRSLEGVDHVTSTDTQDLPEFEHHCPLMSLPLALRLLANNTTAPSPYLQANLTKVEFWKKQFGPKTKPRIGLVWSGGFREKIPELWGVNARRNIPLAMLLPLSKLEAQFFSLQKGETAEAELKELQKTLPHNLNIIDLADQLAYFSDTAAVIENLDLIISVDTSTAHLAAALGKPTWILNRFDSCWRWLQEGQESIWYPSVKIYRQHAWQDWSIALEKLKADLDHFLNS